MTEDENAFDKVKRGLKETAEGVKEGVEDTAEGFKEGVEDTAEGIKETASEVTDSDTYTSSYQAREKSEYDLKEGKEPMNPQDIASHEPTAVIRENDTDIAQEGQTGTNSPEADEKYRKKGMTQI